MMLVAGTLTLVGAAPKAACANATFAATGATSLAVPCYSDLSVLYAAEGLDQGRFPYLEACPASDRPCDEYPVGTMVVMWAAARTGGAIGGFAGFFWTNVAVMLVCAGVCVWVLERMRARTILFAAAPALGLYATLNWDLIAVAAATLATWLVVRRRSVASGAWLGIGAAAKLYPALLAIPFWAQRRRDDGGGEGVRLTVSAGVAWLVMNLAFLVASPTAWLEVFRFNSTRGKDFESVWTALCQLHVCLSGTLLNVSVAALAVGGSAALWSRVMRRHPDTPPWIMGLPILVVVIVTSKFWSPQYALWLLPWFALSRIPVTAWLAYQATEVMEFFARTSYMSGPSPGISLSGLSVFVVLRAAALLWCLATWMRDPGPAVSSPADVAVRHRDTAPSGA
jgi:uncharacterized membrane protein